MVEVKCDWTNCQNNKEGKCVCNEIRLQNYHPRIFDPESLFCMNYIEK